MYGRLQCNAFMLGHWSTALVQLMLTSAKAQPIWDYMNLTYGI